MTVTCNPKQSTIAGTASGPSQLCSRRRQLESPRLHHHHKKHCFFFFAHRTLILERSRTRSLPPPGPLPPHPSSLPTSSPSTLSLPPTLLFPPPPHKQKWLPRPQSSTMAVSSSQTRLPPLPITRLTATRHRHQRCPHRLCRQTPPPQRSPWSRLVTLPVSPLLPSKSRLASISNHPANHPRDRLWIQRRTWALDALRTEGARSILDFGCGPGSLLQTAVIPPSTVPEKPIIGVNGEIPDGISLYTQVSTTTFAGGHTRARQRGSGRLTVGARGWITGLPLEPHQLANRTPP